MLYLLPQPFRKMHWKLKVAGKALKDVNKSKIGNGIPS